jgi:ribose transport system substrate-binding protein
VDLASAQSVADQYTKPITEITQKKALSKPAPTGKKIIFANSGLPATQLIQGGVKEAAEALGWSFETVTYENANPATLQSALQTALSKKPDAVIIAGNAPKTYGAATLKAYKDAKVPLIVGSVCPLTVVDPLVAGMAGCEVEEAAGKALANWFIADSKGKGKALFVNVKAIPSLAAFVKAFSTEVDAKCASCDVQVLEATLTQVTENQVVPSAVNKLRADSSFNYLLFDNAQFSKGIVPALKAAGLDGKVTVGGRSADEGAIGALKAGAKGAWTAMPYNVLGYGNVDSAIRSMLGETDAQPVIPPVQLLTSKNAADVQVPFRAPQDALDQYKKIWGLS